MTNPTRIKAALNSIAQADDNTIEEFLGSADHPYTAIEDATTALEDFLALEDPTEIEEAWEEDIQILCIEVEYYCG